MVGYRGDSMTWHIDRELHTAKIILVTFRYYIEYFIGLSTKD